MRNRRASTSFFFRTGIALAISCLTLGSYALAAEEAGTIKTLKGTARIERGGQKTPAAIGGKLGGIFWGRIVFSLAVIYVLVKLINSFASSTPK